MLVEKRNDLIGAYYAAHRHTLEKLMIPQHSGQFKSPLNDVSKERSTT